MNKKQFLDAFKNWMNKNDFSSSGMYGTYVNKYLNYTFEQALRQLLSCGNSGNWNVNKISNSVYQEMFNGNTTQQKYPGRTNFLYNYYKDNIENNNNYDFLQIIVDFLNENDVLHALSIIEIMDDLATKAIALPSASKVRMNDRRSAIRKLQKFVSTYEHNIVQIPSPYVGKRNKLTKPNIHKIDGIEELAKFMGEDNFIREAIEQSYFFDPELAIAQMEDLVEKLQRNDPIPARRTTKQDEECGITDVVNPITGEITYGNIKVFFGKDENQIVRSMIVNKTGYTVGSGKECIFQNYIISHIWGQAFDPRFFTNLWNIVLVPAWANSLLDKDSVPESLASKLKATFMQICCDLYFKKIKKEKKELWGDDGIKMNQPNVVNPKDVIRPQSDTPYNLNIIKKIDEKYSAKLGPIIKQIWY